MKEVSDLTYKVAAFSEVPNFAVSECIDWALEMMSLGYDSPSLEILAGLSNPANYFEAIEYLKKSFEELGLLFKTGREGIISYSSYCIIQISKGQNLRENLQKINQFCIDKNYEDSIYDFYLLNWAWSDFDYGNLHQEYWPDAKPETIEEIVTTKAKDWIIENESYFEQVVNVK